MEQLEGDGLKRKTQGLKINVDQGERPQPETTVTEQSGKMKEPRPVNEGTEGSYRKAVMFNEPANLWKV